MQLNCKGCNEVFSEQGTMNQARVLPCGYSLCERCINQRLNSALEVFQCDCCTNIHDMIALTIAPPNRLYYELLDEVNELLKRKEWQRQNKEENDSQKDERTFLDEEFKCLYPFCHRIRYEKDGIKEVFCSAKCQQLNQALYF